MLYLEEYLDTIEGLPMELQRQFTLMRELDALSQELQSKMQTDITDYLDNLPNMTREERVTKLQSFTQLFSNALKHGEEKVALATQTYELVDKHIRKLDEDLAKFELRQLTMPPRIAHSWGPGATTLSVDKSTSPQAGDGGPSKSGESGGSGTKSGLKAKAKAACAGSAN
ncbi:hypothetical protein EV182_001893 [Spiromyces aspiralis]|uniref:Uncharacterized protein n=1 Tax=Spiromyces aspiralis TaxID=68401 RepID=A0ACC1HHK4_9FUNG|nr:hypothetical protein EV182_001893 [Spiromyces aspiralis]